MTSVTTCWLTSLECSEGEEQQQKLFYSPYAAFLWAQKVVFTSFPVGNCVSLGSEVVITSGKVGQADSKPSFRVGKTWRLSMIWKVKYFNLYI